VPSASSSPLTTPGLPKIEADTPTAELAARWQNEARQLGHDAEDWLGAVTGRARGVEPLPDAELVARAIECLGESAATFGRSDVVEVVTTLVEASDAAGVRRRVEELAERVLAGVEVCSLAALLPAEPPVSLRRDDGMAVIERHGGTRFATGTTLANEAAVLEAVAAGRGARVARRRAPGRRAGARRVLPRR
jgi:hypothetical protein